MATSRKTASKDSPRKSTPAGPRSRAKTSRKQLPADVTEAPVDAAHPAAKTRAPLRAVADPVTDAASDAPEAASEGADDTRFKRGNLIEAVAERTALKRSDAKVVLELVLEELGRALDANEELVLPPLGKLMVKKRKPDADGPDILTIKIRRPRTEDADTGESALADPDEDS